MNATAKTITMEEMVKLATEINKVMSLNISTDKAKETDLRKDIMKASKMLVSSDFDGKGGFSKAAREQFTALGIAIPEPKKIVAKPTSEMKAEKAANKKTSTPRSSFNRWDAIAEAMKTEKTAETISKKANKIYCEHNGADKDNLKEHSKVVRDTLKVLLAFGLAEEKDGNYTLKK